MEFRPQIFLVFVLLFVLSPSIEYSKETEKLILRSMPASLNKSELLQAIKDKGLDCPGEKVKGKIKHQWEFQTLEGKDVVVDHTTGLMWQKAEESTRLSWKEAEAYVKQMNEEHYAGFSNWRIPTAEELSSLLTGKKKKEYYIDPLFQEYILSTWTADMVTGAFAGAWFVDFSEGKPVDGNRAAGLGDVRLVRTVPMAN